MAVEAVKALVTRYQELEREIRRLRGDSVKQKKDCLKEEKEAIRKQLEEIFHQCDSVLEISKENRIRRFFESTADFDTNVSCMD